MKLIERINLTPLEKYERELRKKHFEEIEKLEKEKLKDMEICGGTFKDGKFIPFYQSKEWSWKSYHKKQE